MDESTYDELPLWSAPFGQVLLETVVLRPGLTVLDVGFGSGFPALELAALLDAAGFELKSARESSFPMRYLDGTTLLAHHFIRLGFLPAWKAVPPAVSVDAVFARLESHLNRVAAARGELRLDIPFVCFDCRAR